VPSESVKILHTCALFIYRFLYIDIRRDIFYNFIFLLGSAGFRRFIICVLFISHAYRYFCRAEKRIVNIKISYDGINWTLAIKIIILFATVHLTQHIIFLIHYYILWYILIYINALQLPTTVINKPQSSDVIVNIII